MVACTAGVKSSARAFLAGQVNDVIMSPTRRLFVLAVASGASMEAAFSQWDGTTALPRQESDTIGLASIKARCCMGLLSVALVLPHY